MRPILLTMQAFGPYNEEVVIDFSKFNQGLFLISGPTGSGKSYIFDALCYALYNEASGDHKDPKMFRSDFASDELITYVKLTFTHQNKAYSVYRKPSYYQKKKKSEEYTLKSSEAELMIDGKLSYTGTAEVTRAIEEILKVKASQFKQIVMIAQGEFLKLLLTKSDERMNIYRRLFNTQHYDEFSNKLKDKFLAIEKEYKQANSEFEAIKQDINIGYDHDDMSAYNEALQGITNELRDTQESKRKDYQDLLLKNNELNIKKSKLENIVSVKSQLEIIGGQLDELSSKSKEIDNKKELIKILKKVKTEYLPLIKELNKVNDQVLANNKSIGEENERLDKYKLELNDIIKQEEVHKLKEEQYNKDKVTLAKVVEQLTIYSKIDEFNVLLNNKTSESQKYVERIQAISKDIDKDNDTLKSLQLSIDNSGNLIEDKTKIELLLKEISQDIQNYSRAEELAIKLKEQKNSSQLFIDKYGEITKRYQAYELDFYANQAGFLAKTLKDKEACPVCGSLEHPRIAKLDTKVVSKSALDDLYQEKEEVRNDLEKSNGELNNFVQEIELIKKTMKNHNIEELNVMNKDCQDQQAAIIEKLKKIANNKETLITITDKLMVKRNELETIKQTHDGLAKDILVSETKRDELTKQLAIGDELTARKQVDQFELSIKNYEARLDDIQINRTRLNELIQTNTGSLSAKKELSISFEKQGILIETDLRAKGYTYDKYGRYLCELSQMDKIEESINDHERTLYKLNIEAQELKKMIEQAPTDSLDDIMIKIDESEKLMHILDEEKEVYQSDITLKQKAYQKINTLILSQGELSKLYTIYKPLSDTANANLSKKQRINFEIFVQSLYFNQVLQAANKRLHKMTMNRFTLMIKENNDYKSISGLDIEVVDEWTKKKRDVKTLSGGESFKASLALALGLSDIIEAKAAGVEFECIFIDEGFGTLDQESLNQALLLLQELVNQNRLVGIISHVEELKHQIDQKIEIKKDYKGSAIRQLL